jgi:hypothetical protein
METASTLVTIITSAAVASVTTALAQFVGARLEARARRRELLLTRALDLAQARTEMVLRVAKETGVTATIRDSVFLAEGYFQWLSHLMDHGKLPPEAKAQEAASERTVGELPEIEVTKVPGRSRRR